MTSTLLINASPYGGDSRAYQMARQICAGLQAADPGARLLERDLSSSDTIVRREYAEAIIGRDPHDVPAFSQSEALIAELEATDHLLIATPMHNFTVPAALKHWIDHVLRIGRSFVPQNGHKVGVLRDRPTLVIVTSGGLVQGERALQPDHLTGYLRDVLATIGIRDVRFAYLEGLAHPGHAESAISAAWSSIEGDPVFGSARAA